MGIAERVDAPLVGGGGLVVESVLRGGLVLCRGQRSNCFNAAS